MIQIAIIAVAVALVLLGIKGFTPGGLALSKTKTLTGTPAKVIGTVCILAGATVLGFVALVILTVIGRQG